MKTDSSPEPASWLAHIESEAQRFETPCGDGSLVWRRWGDGAPALLLHGSHGYWAHWARNISELARYRSIWIPDLPGMGDSAMPSGTDHAAVVDALAHGWRVLCGPESAADVVGFSFGGVIASHFAARHPALVHQLIVVDPGGLDTPLGHLQLRGLKGLDSTERLAAQRHNLLAVMLHDPANASDLAMHIYTDGVDRSRFNPAPLIMPDHLIRVLNEVAAPLAAIWGEKDAPHADPAVQEAALRHFRPDLHFRVVPDAGHWCMFEQPDAFNAMLLDLLARK